MKTAKGKGKYMVVGVLEDRTSGKREVAGYRVMELATGNQKNLPLSFMGGANLEYTNLHRKKGSQELKGNFDGYPVIDFHTNEILENRGAKLVVFEANEDTGVSKKQYYRVMDIRGKAEWLAPDDLIRFYQGDIANMSIVTPAKGKRYLRKLPNQYIPEKSKLPNYTQKAFKNEQATEELTGHWLVRLIRPGEQYGLDLVLTNETKEILVEFIDAKSHQFVSRYNLSTILEHSKGVGLNLHGGVPAWKVTGKTMDKVVEWLANVR